MAATRSNQNAQSLPLRCHCPISCLLLLPPGTDEFPSSSPVLPDGPENAGQRGDVKVPQQLVPASGLRTVPFLSGEERAGVRVPFCRARCLAASCPTLSAEDGAEPMCVVG